jgi:hypothetical protein
LQLKYSVMKSATRLQFPSLIKGVARAGAWAVLTLMVGLIMVILFGSPLAASSSPSSNDLPGSGRSYKTGPWVYPPVQVGV